MQTAHAMIGSTGSPESNEGLFAALWTATGAHGSYLPVFQDLERRYSAPGRRYHTLEHVRWALKRLIELCGGLPSLEAVWAIWFHDAVLERSEHDEELSAALACGVAIGAGLSPEFGIRVHQLICGTAHDAPEYDGEAQAVCDADLSVLAAPDADFDAYEARVRTEWKDVPESAFRQGRALVLKRFLARESIYQTAHARKHWEARARRNLERSIGRLMGGAAIPCEQTNEAQS